MEIQHVGCGVCPCIQDLRNLKPSGHRIDHGHASQRDRVTLILISKGAFACQVDTWGVPWNCLWFLPQQWTTLLVVLLLKGCVMRCRPCTLVDTGALVM